MIWIALLALACTEAPTPGADAGTGAVADTGSAGGTETAEDSGTTADSGGAEAEAVVHTLTVQELKDWLDGGKDFLLINVHTPYAGEIPGTDVHVPYYDTELLTETIGEDLDTLTVVYCLTGPMSAQASADLVALGYRAIYDLPEAMVGWEAAGYPLDP